MTIGSFNVTDTDPAAQRQYPISRNVRPLNDRVLIRRIADQPNQPGIVTPEIAGKPSRRGVVVSVGGGKRSHNGHRIPLAVRPGDIIYFGRYTDYDDGELLLIQEADIVGVVEDLDHKGVVDG